MADRIIKIKVIVEYGEDKTWEKEEVLLDPKIPYMREGEFILTHKIQGLGEKIVPLALKEIIKEFPNANN